MVRRMEGRSVVWKQDSRRDRSLVRRAWVRTVRRVVPVGMVERAVWLLVEARAL